MPERTVAVASATGLHARPAKLFAEAAAQQPVPVRIRVGDRAVPAGSLLSVLTLGVEQGTQVTLEADEAERAEEALDALAAMLARDLDAD